MRPVVMTPPLLFVNPSSVALLLPLAVGRAFLAYFGYHAFNGAFGIWLMDRLTSGRGACGATPPILKRQADGAGNR